VYKTNLNQQIQTTQTYPQSISGNAYIEMFKGALKNSQLVSLNTSNNTGTLNTQSSFSQEGVYFSIIYEVPTDCGPFADFCILPTHQDIQDWLQYGNSASPFSVPPSNFGIINFNIAKDTQTIPTLTYSQEDGYEDNNKDNPKNTSFGLNPDKGTAPSTPFTFKTVYESTSNIAPTYTNLVVSDGTNTQTFLMIKDTSASTTASLKDGDFTNKEQYTYQDIVQKGKYTYHFEASDGINTIRLPETGELSFEAGYSNVVFFPGILGSRLYREEGIDCSTLPSGTTPSEPCLHNEELWVSKSDTNQSKLAMDSDGNSVSDVYTINDTQHTGLGDETGIVDDAYNFNVYQSFIENLQSWKNENTINDYAFIPYDWRLSLQDIITNGKATADGRLSYLNNQNFSESFILQKLREMQASSADGKVTLVTHSNGGLVVKALIEKLKKENDPLYEEIENIIFVAVPEMGTLDAVAVLLYGEKLGLAGFVMNAERFRDLSNNMPVAYNLLPSKEYFTSTISKDVPIAEFDDPSFYAQEILNYGSKIKDYDSMKAYLLGEETRNNPNYDDLINPVKANPNIYASSTVEINLLNSSWQPTTTTKVVEVAGWG
jgi:hypothetical protein